MPFFQQLRSKTQEGQIAWEIGTDIYILLYIKSLEKEMATHTNVLAWRIPWIKEPGGLQSMSSQRVGHVSNKGPTTQHKELSTL